MSWLRVDDGFVGHPKLVRAASMVSPNGRARCIALWIEALTFCSRYLTDGRFSLEESISFASEARPKRVLNALVIGGLLDRLEDGSFCVHNYLKFNESAESIRLRRVRDVERKKKFQPESKRTPRGIQTDSSRNPSASRARVPSHTLRTAPPRLQSEGGSAVPPAESAPQSPAPSEATPDTTPLSPEEAKKRWGEIKTKVLGDIEKRKAERAAGNGQIVEGDGKPIDWSQFPNASPLDGAPPEEPPEPKPEPDDGPTYDARPSADFNEGGDP